MDSRKKKGNKKNNQTSNINTNSDTQVLDTKKTNDAQASKIEEENKKENLKKELSKNDNSKKNTKDNNIKEDTEKIVADQKAKQEDSQKEVDKTDRQSSSTAKKNGIDFSADHVKTVAVNAGKVLLPVGACAIVIAVIVSFASSQKSQTAANTLKVGNGAVTVGAATLSDEPLSENAHTDINDLMRSFYTALADGDMDTVRSSKDYNTDREIITYEKKSEFIERYDNVNCYTKPGIENDSFFVYVTYDVKVKDIDTEAPGLNAWYVYTAKDGSLKIDGDTEESIKAAFKLVTNQDDVVDLYNKIDVDYKNAIASDAALNQFMEELPDVITESVGVALAQLETQEEDVETPQTETVEASEPQSEQTEASTENEEPLQNKEVNQLVRTTDTVNVRSSDSEEADKIGKAQEGTELTRIEERINGWSKVIFENREAFIKSDYLEVVSNEVLAPKAAPNQEPQPQQGTGGMIIAKTNVNVRNAPNQDSDKIGTASGGESYELVEDQGEWYKINFNGSTGFVKAEFFER